MAVDAGCRTKPFTNVRMLPPDNGEHFFGAYRKDQVERTELNQTDPQTRRCMCNICGNWGLLMSAGEAPPDSDDSDDSDCEGDIVPMPSGIRMVDMEVDNDGNTTRKRKRKGNETAVLLQQPPPPPPPVLAPRPPMMPTAQPMLPHQLMLQWQIMQQMQQPFPNAQFNSQFWQNPPNGNNPFWPGQPPPPPPM